MFLLKDIKLGARSTISHTFSVSDVKKYADITGDANPLHLDKEYASKTIFKKPIVQGLLICGMIGRILGTILPGSGTIYLNQTLSFKSPVYVGDKILCVLEIIKIRDDKPIITLSTKCINKKNITVIDGEAVVLFPPLLKNKKKL